MKKEDGTLIVNPDEINSLLISHLESIQGRITEENQGREHLPPLSIAETEALCTRMSKNKGISLDLISDRLFHLNSPKLTEVLSRLWTIPLNRIKPIHFEARLVALNKVHPQLPKPNEFRPIIVMSPLLKFLEARFASKLSEYCLNQMQPS